MTQPDNRPISDFSIREFITDGPLLRLVESHSADVRDKALDIARRINDTHGPATVDIPLLIGGAMAHDVGVVMCDAPGILCRGTAPYLLHGALGGWMLRRAGYPLLARFAERHTGTGLTLDQVADALDEWEARTSLPADRDAIAAIRATTLEANADFIPETVEERIVCYADKFFSKSHPERRISAATAAKKQRRWGDDSYQRFARWAEEFGEQLTDDK